MGRGTDSFYWEVWGDLFKIDFAEGAFGGLGPGGLGVEAGCVLALS